MAKKNPPLTHLRHVDASVDHVAAREEGGAGRAADRLHVVVLQDDSSAADGINVWRRNLWAPMQRHVIPSEGRRERETKASRSTRHLGIECPDVSIFFQRRKEDLQCMMKEKNMRQWQSVGLSPQIVGHDKHNVWRPRRRLGAHCRQQHQRQQRAHEIRVAG